MIVIPTQTFLNLPKEKRDRVINAAVEEFGKRRFHEAKLSNIIKDAKIPRGSFYQYFEDKMDLYLHLYDIIGQRKMEYMTDELKNPHNLAFFDLFRALYKQGLKFALENPDYIKIFNLLMAQKDDVYKKVFKNNLDIAHNFYKSMIIRDQELGKMDSGIDPDTLAKLVIDMTMNVTVEALEETPDHINPKVYEENIEKIIYIFEKGMKR